MVEKINKVSDMSLTKQVINSEPIIVNQRISELSLTREGLLTVRDASLAAAADATLFHPVNAPGSFSYHQGVFALRNEFIGEDWEVDRVNGVETISNKALNVRVGFSNVDIACDINHDPKARSKKGSGTERTLQENLFGNLPKYAPRQNGTWLTYYIMVDPKGAVELSLPIIQGDNFGICIQRNFISDGSDLDLSALPVDEDDFADISDPLVSRK